MKKILVVFGTRPEAIKMCPLVKQLKLKKEFKCIVCVSGQHREMLNQVLKTFEVVPDFDLSIMKEKQTLFEITVNLLEKLKLVLEETKPDLVLVHGDTSTTFITSLACYYLKIPIGHVEAGLRTNDIFSPFPEEFNRQAVGLIAKYHFAPTEVSKNNLIKEGKDPLDIYVTGNTGIDALKFTVVENFNHKLLEWVSDSKLVLVTIHRRENLGQPMKNIFNALKKLVNVVNYIKVIYPIHMNPEIRKIANSIIGENDRIKIIEPLDVIDFHNFMAKSHIILTDSGGIQEEAPSLGIPVLVLRDKTERPEGVSAGTLKLVGTDENVVFESMIELLNNETEYNKMSFASNPYGDGFSSKKIADLIYKKIILEE